MHQIEFLDVALIAASYTQKELIIILQGLNVDWRNEYNSWPL